jgi:hypothetical protein
MPEVHTLITGLALGESPRWHAGRLWLSGWVAHEVLAVDLSGMREVITNVQSLPFCIDFLPDGRLLVVSDTLHVRPARLRSCLSGSGWHSGKRRPSSSASASGSRATAAFQKWRMNCIWPA